MMPECRGYRIRLTAEPEGGYTVTVPALRGCVTWGRDADDAVEKARECIDGFHEARALSDRLERSD
ncbi:MAG: type II toxin-antitoxin system HicB family antitoxin [Acidobacteriota bacterium]